jgi:uncharacterized protein
VDGQPLSFPEKRRLMGSVAIVGTGIAGMAAGYFLRNAHDVTFYEKNSYAGGHTNTVLIDEDVRPVPIDTGFMVYNEATYPNLVRLFKELGVPVQPTSMSFSVQHVPSGLDYCGTGIAGLFAQRRNLFNPSFFRLLFQIDRFNKQCVEILDDPRYDQCSLAEYAAENKLTGDFLDKYLIPMSSAIWSTEPGRMLDFPARTLVRFFKNHGLLGLTTHYPWLTVAGGSRVYRDKIMGHFKDRVRLGTPAVKVSHQDGRSLVRTANGKEEAFDRVVLACHADEALALLADPTPEESDLLGKFKYQRNRVALHTDESVMPKTRAAWSSWNYRADKNNSTTIYWMNSLQKVSKKKDYFISVNDPGLVDPKKILWKTEYDHPIYDGEAVLAQGRLEGLNRNGKRYFCGSYFKYGFHEDALVSAIEVCRAINGKGPWT